MRPLIDMDNIQIEITNACVHECANCTRLVGHAEKPFFMSLTDFMQAVDSLADYPKMIGIMGGEPLLHPQFEQFCTYLKSRIPRERCGLWSTLPKGRGNFAPLIAEVFGNVLLNDHTHGDIYHCPVLVSPEDMELDDFTFWYRVDHCWVQNSWSASITPKGAFFCEIAGALDMVLNGPGGWAVTDGWWKKTPRDFLSQSERYCRMCGAAFPLKARRDTDGIDDLSASMLKRLHEVNSPKVRKGRYLLYDQGFVQEDSKINLFRRDNDYFLRIAARYGLGLRPNNIGYLEPYLLQTAAPISPELDPIDLIPDGERSVADAAMIQGDAATAAELYDACLTRTPHDAGLLYDYGCALSNLGRYDEAAEVLCRALALEPANPGYNLMLAFIYQYLKRNVEALHYYRLVERTGGISRIGQGAVQAYFLAGRAAVETGQHELGREFLQKCLEVNPAYTPARFLHCMSGIGYPASVKEAEAMRRRFTNELEELISLTDLYSDAQIDTAFTSLGEAVPYYLAYQGKNDRLLQSRLGNFLTAVMTAKFPACTSGNSIRQRSSSDKLKIGFVSAHFYNHSVWKIITRGWLRHLNREKFTIYCWSSGTILDQATDEARQLADHFFASSDVSELVKEISAHQLDAIIYPAIGMDHHSQQLAALRLAPVQCVAWGHPVTTGISTVDYFLSSDLMEPADTREHYSEQLVRLPNLSICYEPIQLSVGNTRVLPARESGEIRYLCCQNLLKYQPQHDVVFARIAGEIPPSRFIFINYSEWHRKTLMSRLQQTFMQYGLTAEDHITFVPMMNASDYASLNREIDIYLDSIGWSGGNTTLESLQHNKPVVTMPGEFMRGRHTSAILTMMGITETIALDTDDYVNIAVRLARDEAWRDSVSFRIARHKHKIYGDTVCVKALEQFLIQACSGRQDPGVLIMSSDRHGSPESHLSHALMLIENGLSREAFEALTLALEQFPERIELWRSLTGLLQDCGVLTFADQLPEASLCRALKLNNGNTDELVALGIWFIRNNPLIAPLIAQARAGNHDDGMDCSTQAQVLGNELLQILMLQSLLHDVEMERFLTVVRRHLLYKTITSAGYDPGNLPFLCALATACFNNEYLFDVTETETQWCRLLQEALESGSIPIGSQPEVIALLASYLPLNSLNAAPGISETFLNCANTHLAPLIRQQLTEPQEEQKLKQTIACITAIADPVSSTVRSQYEENPYPRWTCLDLPVAASISETISIATGNRLAAPVLRDIEEPDILIAGCGTGQHAFFTAARFRNARVLAIDLSRTSLAFAMRMAGQLQMPHISFAQADLLELTHLETRFDVIEAGGVLHHIDDPLRGMGVLRDLLKPGGLLGIGLYSSLGRRNINEARRFVIKRGFRIDLNGIRRCRHELLSLPMDHPARKVIQLRDFYSVSGCRDLLFHVQEHQFDIIQIASMLQQLGLTFLGFQVPETTREKFRNRFPDGDVTSFENWQRFEETHPETFIGMYKFWAHYHA